MQLNDWTIWFYAMKSNNTFVYCVRASIAFFSPRKRDRDRKGGWEERVEEWEKSEKEARIEEGRMSVRAEA